jgi:hypothetical protein
MSRLPDWLRPFIWPIVAAVFFATIYAARIHREMADFDVYRTAAARAAEAENLYRPDDGHYQYKYLPAFAFPMLPFARLSQPAARVIWYALSCGLLVALIRWSVRALPERNLTERSLVWLAILLLAKFYGRELNLGQSNILLGALLVAALLCLQIDARRMAAVLVGLGVFVKVYAAILLPWLWVAAGASSVAVALAVIAAGLVLPALAYGWHGNLAQLSAWSATVSETTAPNLLNPDNVSAAAMWAKWTGFGDHIGPLVLVTCALALALPAVALSRRKTVADPLYLEFGLLMLLVPILSPQGWDYVLLLATPAVLCLVDRWRLVTRPWQIVTGTAIFFMSFTIFDLMGRTLYRFMMDISVMTIAVLTLAVALVHLRWKGLA